MLLGGGALVTLEDATVGVQPPASRGGEPVLGVRQEPNSAIVNQVVSSRSGKRTTTRYRVVQACVKAW